jgi:hypothetical protein
MIESGHRMVAQGEVANSGSGNLREVNVAFCAFVVGVGFPFMSSSIGSGHSPGGSAMALFRSAGRLCTIGDHQPGSAHWGPDGNASNATQSLPVTLDQLAEM